MDIDTAVKKALVELKIERVYMAHHRNILKRYLYMVFAVGFDNGRKIHSNRKQVIQMDKFGNYMSEFESIAEASRITRVSKTGIKDACNGKYNQAKGFHWKYVDNNNQLKERKVV